MNQVKQKPQPQKLAEPSKPEILHRMLKTDVWYIDSSNEKFDTIYLKDIQVKAQKHTYELVESL